MRRYSLPALIATLAVVWSVVVSQALGQAPNGPPNGAVQNTNRPIQAAVPQNAPATAGPMRQESNIPLPPASPQLNPAGNANAAAKVRPGGIIAAPQPPAASQADPVMVRDNRPDAWRYRRDNGRWWYWTPENRWMIYSDNGSWVEYQAAVPSAVPYTTGYGTYDVPSTGYYYDPGYGYYYPGYWRGYYRPGVYVGVGGVGVRVGGWGYRGWWR